MSLDDRRTQTYKEVDLSSRMSNLVINNKILKLHAKKYIKNNPS